MTAESSKPKIDITLSSLLSGHADVVYAVPSLLVSLILTFAGAFLTLDRTRSFASKRGDEESPIEGVSLSSRSKFKRLSWWVFQGGIGGLCGAWAFATHSVALLTLFLANQTNAAPLSTAEFLVVYIMSSILCAILAGRFKLVALILTGLTGGVGFAMILSVVLHPSLITRQVFVALFAPVTAVMSSLPIVRTQHGALRFASASCGSFGLVVSITLLAHESSWQNVWERLWLPSSVTDDWGTGVERGFGALACLSLVLGIVSDWYLNRKFGENPDEKWNTYLSEYSKSVSNASDRAGVFEHSKNWWQRPFHGNKLRAQSTDTLNPSVQRSKNRRKRDRSTRFKVQFRPLGDYSDSESDSELESTKKAALDTPSEMLSLPSRPWLLSPTSPSLSGPTLYGSDDELDKPYSSNEFKVDCEYDLNSQDITDTGSAIHRAPRRDEPGWKPDFLAKQASLTAVPGPVPGAVPMTPSLLRAIDRIKVAQSEAYPQLAHSLSSPTLSTSPPREVPQEHDDTWRTFWKNVLDKSSQT